MDAIQVSFLGGEDDERQRKEQRQQRAAKKLAKQVAERPWPDGPCCGRCRHWTAPDQHDDYGTCGALAVTTKRLPGRFEKGAVLAIEEATQWTFLEWEYLPCGPRFDCSRFEAKAMEDEAA